MASRFCDQSNLKALEAAKRLFVERYDRSLVQLSSGWAWSLVSMFGFNMFVSFVVCGVVLYGA